jgi:hypothetical protein
MDHDWTQIVSLSVLNPRVWVIYPLWYPLVRAQLKMELLQRLHAFPSLVHGKSDEEYDEEIQSLVEYLKEHLRDSSRLADSEHSDLQTFLRSVFRDKSLCGMVNKLTAYIHNSNWIRLFIQPHSFWYCTLISLLSEMVWISKSPRISSREIISGWKLCDYWAYLIPSKSDMSVVNGEILLSPLPNLLR